MRAQFCFHIILWHQHVSIAGGARSRDLPGESDTVLAQRRATNVLIFGAVFGAIFTSASSGSIWTRLSAWSGCDRVDGTT
jgi:hypothetical protein